MFCFHWVVSLQVESNLSERKTVLEVCETIVKRGGSLAGAGIVGIVQKMEEDQIRPTLFFFLINIVLKFVFYIKYSSLLLLDL